MYSRALSRPDPQDIAQAVSVTLDQTPLLASLGNPALKAENGQQLRRAGGALPEALRHDSGGFFYKQLYEPTVRKPRSSRTTVRTRPTVRTRGNVAGYSARQRRQRLADGAEVADLQHFTALPRVLGGLGLTANYARTNSQASGLPGRSDSPRLLRQAPTHSTSVPRSIADGFPFASGMTYNGASIYAYQYQDGTGGSSPTPGGLRGPDGDNHLYRPLSARRAGQLSAAQRMAFKVVVYGLNLTNEVFGFYNGRAVSGRAARILQPDHRRGVALVADSREVSALAGSQRRCNTRGRSEWWNRRHFSPR